MLENTNDYRSRAVFCVKRAAQCISPEARDKFAHMARIWMKLAVQVEEERALLDEWGDYRDEAGRCGPKAA